MFTDTAPKINDSDNNLLFKIAQMLNSGGGGIGVLSFNGRAGVVSLTSGDVTTALGFTPISQANGDARYVLKSGDVMTGALTIGNGVLVASAPALNLNQTWNNGAVEFTGLLANYTNTASSTNSNLFNFQVDGVDRFNFTPGGSFRVVRQDATDSGMNLFLRKRGNAGSATGAVASDSTIGTVAYSGWDGAAFATGSRISGLASQAWTGAAHGSRIDLYTTPVGSVTEQITLRLDSTGQAKFLDGTAALPALSFQSDPDTGIYRIGADSFALATGGVRAIAINSAQKVGIGTDTPAEILSVVVPTSNYVFLGTRTGGASFGIYCDTLQGAFGTKTNHSFSMFTNDGPAQVTLLTTGKLGIGTATPSSHLTLGVSMALAFDSGANQRAGNTTLVAGTKTVANTTVTANTIVLLTRKTAGGTIGTAITYSVIAATSFTIQSDSVIDTSTFSYMLVEVP